MRFAQYGGYAEIPKHDSAYAESLRPGTRSAVLDIARDSWDGGDPYGSVMSWWFAVANCLWNLGEVVPHAWEYRHGMGSGIDPDEFPDGELWELVERGEVKVEDLVYAGDVCQRYAERVKRAGLDY